MVYADRATLITTKSAARCRVQDIAPKYMASILDSRSASQETTLRVPGEAHGITNNDPPVPSIITK